MAHSCQISKENSNSTLYFHHHERHVVFLRIALPINVLFILRASDFAETTPEFAVERVLKYAVFSGSAGVILPKSQLLSRRGRRSADLSDGAAGSW